MATASLTSNDFTSSDLGNAVGRLAQRDMVLTAAGTERLPCATPALPPLLQNLEVAGSIYETFDLPRETATQQLIRRAQADMLYTHGLRGLAMNLLASVLLIMMVNSPAGAGKLFVWLLAICVVSCVRAIDVLVWHPARRNACPDWSGRTELVCFAAGTLATAGIWAIFPPVFFPDLGALGRTAAAIVMAALAGGSPSVLASCLPLSVAYCAAQVIPASLLFFVYPGRENVFLGVLGLASFPAIVLSACTAHRAMMHTVKLSIANRMLVMETERQRQRTEAANRELKAAQVELNEINFFLEQRIEERTADLAREVSDRERYAEALGRLASTDPLTELANRAAFVTQLSAMLEQAAANRSTVALLFIDLDKFKQVNDVRGHATGDHVLQAAARLLSRHAGERGLVARWGGDEFVVAVADIGGSEPAMALAHRIRRAFATPIKAGLDMLRVDATIGIALYPEHAGAQDELIRAADVAMYEGKKEGGGRIKLFDPVLGRDVADRHMLEQALRDAIDNGDFSLVFQPIVSARNLRCEALEALIRWCHPVQGMISPSVFIPVAEQSGQIGAIGRWVLREACRAAAAWPGDAPPVTVNVSVEQVLSGTLVADVQAALDLSGLPVHRLQLEITESLFVTDQSRVTGVIDALRAAGVHILMDDFGAGYSSLACLSSLPLDVIKIDKGFVQAEGAGGDAFIQAILLIARSMQLRVIAEGIETESQRRRLTNLGVDLLQGYLFARPMAGAEVAEWLVVHGAGMQLETLQRVG
jgi:diguanylate cyclase (GGDEF)-like protein